MLRFIVLLHDPLSLGIQTHVMTFSRIWRNSYVIHNGKLSLCRCSNTGPPATAMFHRHFSTGLLTGLSELFCKIYQRSVVAQCIPGGGLFNITPRSNALGL